MSSTDGDVVVPRTCNTEPACCQERKRCSSRQRADSDAPSSGLVGHESEDPVSSGAARRRMSWFTSWCRATRRSNHNTMPRWFVDEEYCPAMSGTGSA